MCSYFFTCRPCRRFALKPTKKRFCRRYMWTWTLIILCILVLYDKNRAEKRFTVRSRVRVPFNPASKERGMCVQLKVLSRIEPLPYYCPPFAHHLVCIFSRSDAVSFFRDGPFQLTPDGMR